MMDLWISVLKLIIALNTQKNEFAKGRNHINGIENFWGYAKHRLSKFKGIKKENFLIPLKETEFRYNTKTKQQDLYKILLKMSC